MRQLVAVKLADFTSLHTLYITSHINAAHLSHLIRDLAFFNLETLVITLYDDEKNNSFPPELIQNLKKLTLLKKFSLSSPSLDTFPEDFFSNFPLLEEVSLCLYKASSNFTIENIGITPQSQLKDVRLTLPQTLANQLDIKNYSSKLPKIQITAYQGK